MGIMSKLVTLEKGLRADFMKAFDNGEKPGEISPFIMETKSTANQEKYGWLGQVPGLIPWVDERQLKGILDFDYTIANVTYEATLQVFREEIEDDQLGAIKVRIGDLAVKAKQTHMRKLFFDALIAGTTDLCYDGQAFFSTSHSEGSSGTQSNYDSSGSGTSVANLKTDFIAARAGMRKLKDDQGDPLNEGNMELYVVIPPDLEGAFDELLIADSISSTTNTLKGAAKKVVSSRLTDADDWYLINGQGNIKAFVDQERRAVEFEALEKGEKAFMSNRFLYGISVRRGFGYGLWQKAFKTAN